MSREGVPDFVKVLDFGIAKQDMGNQNSPRRLTTPGIAMGTPEYMAPEQAAGKAIDGRVDIYSVGAILYEMLTADPPHHGANVMEILAKKATESPTPPRELNPDVPEALEEVVMRCLERDPDRRPQTMGALEYELTKSAEGARLGGGGGARPQAVRRRDVLDVGRGVVEAAPLRHRRDSGTARVDAVDSGAAHGHDRRAAAVGRRGQGPRQLVDPAVVAGAASRPRALVDGGEAHAELRAARRAGRWGSGWRSSALLAFLGGAGGAGIALRRQWRRHQAGDGRPTTKPTRLPDVHDLRNEVEQPDEHAPRPSQDAPRAAKGATDKMSPAEIDRMLEWARRTAEGGRILAPPGDNLKELLERIDKADPGNAQAEALKQRTTAMLGRKGTLALKKGRARRGGARTSTRSSGSSPTTSARRVAWRARSRCARSARSARTSCRRRSPTRPRRWSTRPRTPAIQLTLGDVHLAMGKRELAAEEFQRVLDVKPADVRAKLGLARATAPKKAAAEEAQRPRPLILI